MSEEYEWIQLGFHQEKKEIFFKKKDVYDLNNTDFAKDIAKHFPISKSILCSCGNGGALAVTRNMKKGYFGGELSTNQIIALYSCSGNRLCSFYWDRKEKGEIRSMEFNDNEELVCMSTQGKVFIFDILGNTIISFPIKQQIIDERILCSKISQNYLVILTRKSRVWMISHFQRNKNQRITKPLEGEVEMIFDDIENIEDDIKMEIVERKPILTEESNHQEYDVEGSLIEKAKDLEIDVYVIIKNQNSITRVSSDQKSTRKLFDQKFLSLAVSQNGNLLALFTADKSIWITNTEQTQISKISKISNETNKDNSFSSEPFSLKWCGNDCIVLYFLPNKSIMTTDTSHKLVLIGPTKEVYCMKLFMGQLYLDTESDGLKIISNSSYSYLSSVPIENRSIFKVGSLEPAATLYDAYSEFINQKASSIKKIRQISRNEQDLEKAVSCCIQAAENSFNPHNQNILLKAASFGKSFIIEEKEQKIHNRFVETCKILRVFNAIRDRSIGLPVTRRQYVNGFPIEKIIKRLANRNQHALSFKICDHLGYSSLKTNLLIHWAKRKALSNESNEVIISELQNRCASVFRNFSYSSIAHSAFSVGKRQLASQLLKFERHHADKVDLFLLMDTKSDIEEALSQALLSGEMDKISKVLHHMKSSRHFAGDEFVSCLFSKKEFKNARKFFFSKLKKENEFEFLISAYSQQKSFNEIANLLLYQSLDPETSNVSKIKLLDKASKIYESKREESQFCLFQIELIELHEKYNQYLLKNQNHNKFRFTDESIVQTIAKLIEIKYKDNEMEIVKELKTKFKIPEKQFYWVVLNTLSKLNRWNDLRAFAKEKKSPIGYYPFYRKAMNLGKMKEAGHYQEVYKCTEE